MRRSRPQARGSVREALVAALPAAVLSGAPSTIWALKRKQDPLEASLAAGSMVLPQEERPARLLMAAAPVHVALSICWALVMGRLLPRRRPITEGMLAGLGIAALDLGIVGRRFPRVRALETAPQILDHLAYGVIVSTVLARRVGSAQRHPRTQ